MGTTAEKLQRALDSKNAVKTSIINKGGNITNTTPFSQYATAIDNLPSGEPLVVEELPTENINEKAIYQRNDYELFIRHQGTYAFIFNEFPGSKLIIVDEQPTENILESSQTVFYCYYIKNMDDVFVYMNLGQGATWIPLYNLIPYLIPQFSGITFKGETYSPFDTTEYGYYLYIKNRKYLYENGNYKIIDNYENTISDFYNDLITENLCLNLTRFDTMNGAFSGSKIKKVTINCIGYVYTVDNPSEKWMTLPSGFASDSAIETLIINDKTELSISLRFGNFIFARCTTLRKLILNFNNIEDIELNQSDEDVTFVDSSIQTGECFIYVPDEIVDTVKALPNLSKYATQIKPISEYVEE